MCLREWWLALFASLALIEMTSRSLLVLFGASVFSDCIEDTVEVIFLSSLSNQCGISFHLALPALSILILPGTLAWAMVAGKDRPRMLPYGTRWNDIGPPINSLLEIRK
jgi:hypothetical protein